MGGTIKRLTRPRGAAELITASEIACFTYCPEHWRLEYGLELLTSILICPALDGKPERGGSIAGS